MQVIWKNGAARGGTAQWVLFGAVAAVVGFVAFILAALGLVAGALLAGITAVTWALTAHRRAGGTAPRPSDGREPERDCVELGREAYTVRIVDEKNPPI